MNLNKLTPEQIQVLKDVVAMQTNCQIKSFELLLHRMYRYPEQYDSIELLYAEEYLKELQSIDVDKLVMSMLTDTVNTNLFAMGMDGIINNMKN